MTHPLALRLFFQARAHELAAIVAFQHLLCRLGIALAHFLLLRGQAFFTRFGRTIFKAVAHIRLTGIPFQALRCRLLVTGRHALLLGR